MTRRRAQEGSVKNPGYVTNLHDNLQNDLDRIKARFKNPKLTLIVRNPDVKDGDVVIGDDDLNLAIESVRKLQKNAKFVVEANEVPR